MIFLRFSHNNVEKSGILENSSVREITGSIFDEFQTTENLYAPDEIKILPPCSPSKIVAVGLNYVDHTKELGHDVHKDPVIFVKLPHTVIGHEDTIVTPENATRVDYEAELAVVICKTCKNVPVQDVQKHILGATCLNDVTERDIQKIDGQWMRAKNFETFCPLGPYIVTGIDYSSLDIKLLLNGEVKQSSNTSSLMWSVDELVSFISRVMPLYPGDVVTTGTPAGVGPMKAGDTVEVHIENVGTLRNFVR